MFCRNDSQLNNCRIVFVDEVFMIELPNERSPLIASPSQREFWSGPECSWVGVAILGGIVSCCSPSSPPEHREEWPILPVLQG